jgi:hypothetical protein
LFCAESWVRRSNEIYYGSFDLKIQTQSLTGAALDWAVGHAVGCEPVEYSTDWAFGGPIIQREGIGIHVARWAEDGEPEIWYAAALASSMSAPARAHGLTALVAAMRCVVLSKVGEDVDVPDELLAAD